MTRTLTILTTFLALCSRVISFQCTDRRFGHTRLSIYEFPTRKVSRKGFISMNKSQPRNENFSTTSLKSSTTNSDGMVEEDGGRRRMIEFPAKFSEGANRLTDFFTSTNNKSIANAILLLFAFGFPLYTILTINHGISRGWSQAEFMMRITLDNWRSYEDALSNNPVLTKTMINVVIYLLGDWLSQTLFQKKDVLDFDANRTLRNGFIGACFGPLVHEYYEFSDYILPVHVGINRLYKIMMDQTIYLSVKCSIYIMAVGMLNGETFEEAKGNVKEKIGPIMFTAWKFWPLVHCVTYGLIPARHRILWVNSVDLIWNAILAQKTSHDDDKAVVNVEHEDFLNESLFSSVINKECEGNTLNYMKNVKVINEVKALKKNMNLEELVHGGVNGDEPHSNLAIANEEVDSFLFATASDSETHLS